MRHLIFIFVLFLTMNPYAARSEETCVPTGKWVEPASKRILDHKDTIARLSQRPVVLLGETHTNREHHRWQLYTIAALHAQNTNMVLAFEAFPRRFQPTLDKWVQGKLSEETFLKEVDWNETWRFDSQMYMKLFNFARIHRVPMVAMNVDRALITRIGKDGWDSIPEKDREGVSNPAPASEEYLDFLSLIFGQHMTAKMNPKKGKIKAHPIPELRNTPMFKNFVQSQVTWDRAMAQKIAETHAKDGKPLVIGIVGQGHLQYGFGIPHQLKDLGVDNAAILLPWDEDQECSDLDPAGNYQVASAVFGLAKIEAANEPEKPKLGVYIVNAKGGGARIDKVVDDSVAQSANLKKGDVILEAAGQPIANINELISTVKGMTHGAWLPLKVKRGDKTIEIIAKFPSKP